MAVVGTLTRQSLPRFSNGSKSFAEQAGIYSRKTSPRRLVSLPTQQRMPSETARFPGLDTLRALAILAVMLFHLQWWLSPMLRPVAQFGWIGVDLFFVLSGYLIGAQLLKAHASAGSVIWPFYRRRIFRILPLYLVVVALYSLWPGCREAGAPAPLWQLLSFTENLFFNAANQPSFTHVWSLCIEEQFYLVLPVALLVALRRPSLGRTVAILLGLVAAGMAVRAWVLVYQLQPLGPDDAGGLYMEHIYYPTYSRMDGLLAGVSLALIERFRPGWWRFASRRGHTSFALGVAAVGVALWLFKDRFESQTGAAAWGTVIGFPLLSSGLACLACSALSDNGLLRRRIPLANRIATLAYSLYLTHKLVAHLARVHLPGLTAERDGKTLVTYGIACFAVAATLHVLVERPSLRLRDRNPKSIVSELREDPAL
jgi:peptidoglycan/LPS O-acetylase OafA/YrhL